MRLIDADNIKEKILAYWGCDPSYYKGTEADRDAYTLSRLEITPTIEAIPVQFIEMWMNENLTNGEDDGEVDTIFEMIRDWEQEGKEYEYKSM